MKAIDTNILIYAQRKECAEHQIAKRILLDLSQGNQPWALPWPCVYEYIRVITHPRVFNPPTRMTDALENLENLLKSPSLFLLHETERHQILLKEVILASKVQGNLIHDAHIAVLLMEHGVSELITRDDDFKKFRHIRVINPFE